MRQKHKEFIEECMKESYAPITEKTHFSQIQILN